MIEENDDIKLENAANESEADFLGDMTIYQSILQLSYERNAQGVVQACERFRLSGGLPHIYGPYLYPALAALGEFDAALALAQECRDDTNTPLDELKILFLARRYEELVRHSTIIISNPLWFGGGRSVVDVYLMRAECFRIKGAYFRARQDVLSAFQAAKEGKLGPKVFTDIRAISKRVRRESLNPSLSLAREPSTFVPSLIGGPHYEGQIADPE